MKCVKCGKEIEDSALFCPYCGEKVEAKEIEEVVIEDKPKEENSVNPTVPTAGFGIAIGLYAASFLMVKLYNLFIGFGDYIIFLLLLPLGILAMVLTAFGRHSNTTRGIKVISWVSLGILIIDYVLMFVAAVTIIGR